MKIGISITIDWYIVNQNWACQLFQEVDVIILKDNKFIQVCRQRIL